MAPAPSPDPEVSPTGPVIDPDTYGLLLRACFDGESANEIMERDDGLIYVGDPSDYFAPESEWPVDERAALVYVKGRVLDIGCGAGRIALALQDRGLEVVAIDEAATCAEVCRSRGVRDARAMRWQDFPDGDEHFDTIVLARNNFGLLGSRDDIAQTLAGLGRLTNEGARLISDSVAPSRGGDAADTHFYRVRFTDRATSWFRYLMFEPDDLADLVAGSGWEVERIIDSGAPRWNFVLRRAS